MGGFTICLLDFYWGGLNLSVGLWATAPRAALRTVGHRAAPPGAAQQAAVWHRGQAAWGCFQGGMGSGKGDGLG